MNNHLKIARKTIEVYLKKQTLPELETIPSELKRRAGCFVSLHSRDKRMLRGCIGTISPTSKNLAYEIINNAVAACQDPRFLPVEENEINNLDIQVDVLSELEPIEKIKLLNPQKYGVVVKTKDSRTGLLLPAIEGIENAAEQVAIAREKAGILPEEQISLFRFTVQRFKEE